MHMNLHIAFLMNSNKEGIIETRIFYVAYQTTTYFIESCY